MKLWKWERYFYLIVTEKPLQPKRLAAIREGKAWLRVKGKPSVNPLFNVAPPRHTPEELDRLIEAVREVELPREGE